MIDKFKKIIIGVIALAIAIAPAINLRFVSAQDLNPSQVPSTVFPRNAATGGKVIISWKIPADADLVAFKIYRSETSGQLGNLIATVSAETYSFQDSRLYDGAAYYYTIASLDHANNEAFAKQVPAIPSSDANSILYPDGTLLRFEGRSTVYKVDSDGRTLHPVSKRVFEVNGYEWNDVLTIPIAWQDSFRYGSVDVYRNGSLVKAAGQGTVYVIDNNQKRPIVSKAIFDALGYKFSNINEIPLSNAGPADSADNYATGSPIVSSGTHVSGVLVKTSCDDTVYLIEGGQKRPIGSISVFVSHNFNFKDVVEIPVSELNGYPTGSMLKFMDGTLVKAGASAVYVINNNSAERIPFRSMTELVGLGYNFGSTVSISDAELSAYILAAPLPV